MDAIDLYLGEVKQQNKHIYSDYGKKRGECCETDENLIRSDIGHWVCRECGMCHTDIVDVIDDYEPYKSPHIVKTTIPYNYRTRNIRRLHKWSNWSYQEVESKKLQDIIRSKDLPIKIIDGSCWLVNEYYIKEKIVSRSKIRISLLCYCVYRSYLFRGMEVDIKNLFDMFNIKPKHYNQLVKKLDNDEFKLFYPPNYTLLSKKYEVDDNEVIKLYSLLFNNKKYRFNRRTLILGVIYYLISKEDKKSFYSKMNISKNTIVKVIKVIEKII